MDQRNSVSIISNRSESQPLSRRRVGSHGILRKLKQLVKVKTLIHDLTQDQLQMIGDYTKILDKHYYEMRSKLGYIVSTNEIYLNNKFIVNLPKQERREEQQDKETVNYMRQLITVWSPSSSLHILWTLFTIILIVIQMLEIPFNFAYTINPPSSMYDTLYVFDQIVLYAFLLDILIQFNTAIYLNGKMEVSRFVIAKEYLKCWFWIDFISSLPYDYILNDESLSKQAQLIQFMRFFKFIKVVRLLRAFKLKKIIHSIEEYISVIQWLFQTVQIIKLFLLIMLISHYVACIWSILAFQEYPNWMSAYGIDNLQWDEQYVSALYFSVTTMITVGYGDIKAKNTNEYIFVIFAMLLASALFGYTTNIVMASFNNSDEVFQQREQMIKRYMNKKKIPTNLRSKVFNYLEWLQQQQLKSQQHEQTIFESLSANLKSELVCLLNGRIIKQIEFLDKFSKDLRSNVAYLLQEQVHGPEEIIIEEGSLGTEFFFVSLGHVNCMFQQRKLGSIKMNSCFGHYGFFKQEPRTATIKAKTFVNLMKLNRSQLLMLANHKESDFEAFHQMMYRVTIENQIQGLQLKCFLCNKESKNSEKKLTDQEKCHIAKYCPRSHFIFKYQQVKELYRKRSKRIIKRRNKSERFSYYMRSKIYLKALNKIHQQFLIQYLKGQQQTYLEISQEEIESLNDNIVAFDIDQIKIFHHYCREHNFNTIIEPWNALVDERLEELRRKKMIIQSLKFQQLLKQRRLNIQRFKSPSPHIQKKFQELVQNSVKSFSKSPQVGQVKDRKIQQTPQLKQRLVVVENVRNKRQQTTKYTKNTNNINEEGSPNKIYVIKRQQLI